MFLFKMDLIVYSEEVQSCSRDDNTNSGVQQQDTHVSFHQIGQPLRIEVHHNPG